MQNVRCSDSTGELSIDRDIVRIDHVTDPNLRRDRLAAFVDAAVGGHVRVAVDDTGRNMSAFTVDDKISIW